jgi:hypothetical protein
VLVIIPAAGTGERWAGHGGIRKQEAVVAGERIVDRLVRQVRPAADAVYVVGPIRARGAANRRPNLDPSRGDIDKVASSRHLWSDTGRTLILFGDVVLTDAAAARIVGDAHGTGWRVYGRHGGSRFTGKRYGELFALSVAPDAHAELDDLIARTVALGEPNRLWHLYRLGVGQPPRTEQAPTRNFVAIADESDDVDTPEEWLTVRALFGSSTAVVIPWREEPSRRPALDYVVDWYREHHRDLSVYLAGHDGGEFSKPLAVNRIARQLTEDVLVVADADLFVPPDNLREAVKLAATNPWVVPQDVVLRLTKEATDGVYRGTVDPWEGEPERRYAAVPGGGLFVIRREPFLRIGGFDERFGMWGAEDQAFRCAADTLLGKHAQLPGVLVHLWHEPMARRETPRWRENVRLLKRYRGVMSSPAAMAELVGVDGEWEEGNAVRYQNVRNGTVVVVPRGSKAAAHLDRRNGWVALDERAELPAVVLPVPKVAPARNGPGSSRSAWAKYAMSLGLDVDGIARDMIIEMCDAHTD